MGDATDLLGLGLTCRYFLPEYTSVCICVFGVSDHPQFVFLLLVVHISDHFALQVSHRPDGGGEGDAAWL